MKWEVIEPDSNYHEDAWHVIVVELEDPADSESPLIAEVFHPEDCRIQITDPPDKTWGSRRYECMTSHEIDNVGYDTMFPDGLELGVYRVRPWLRYHPSTPSHGGEWDSGVEVIDYEQA